MVAEGHAMELCSQESDLASEAKKLAYGAGGALHADTSDEETSDGEAGSDILVEDSNPDDILVRGSRSISPVLGVGYKYNFVPDSQPSPSLDRTPRPESSSPDRTQRPESPSPDRTQRSESPPPDRTQRPESENETPHDKNSGRSDVGGTDPISTAPSENISEPENPSDETPLSANVSASLILNSNREEVTGLPSA